MPKINFDATETKIKDAQVDSLLYSQQKFTNEIKLQNVKNQVYTTKRNFENLSQSQISGQREGENKSLEIMNITPIMEEKNL